MKIFFSYGRKTGAAFVERLYAALTQLGHQCWKDDHQIEPGKDWRERIWAGLRDTEHTLAFLTGHALRDHSPCLDELRIARHYNGPITPVLLERVDVPPRLDRRNAIDMTDWPARGDDPAWFADQVARLVAVLDDPETVQQAALMRDLRRWLIPALHEFELPFLLRDFFGRQWLFGHVERWRLDPARPRMVCITGGPGAGKSAFAAWLAHEHRGTAIALNLCKHGQAERNEPGQVIRTLAYLIAAELPDYRAALHLRLSDEGARKAMQDAGALSLFDRLLLEPLHNLVDGRSHERLLLVVDSLDESMQGGASPLLTVLRTKAPHLPDWIALVLTSRAEPRLAAELRGLLHHDIDADPGNADDVTVFARGWLGGRAMPEAEREALIARVAAAAAGNMLALTLLRRSVEEGKLDLAGRLPQGLDGILLDWMRRQFPDAAQYAREVRPVLDMLAAAGRPVPLSLVEAAQGGWSAPQRQAMLEQLGSLFPLRGGALYAWHDYLMQFLAQSAPSGYMTDPDSGARALHAQLWTQGVLAAPDDFAAAVLPGLVARRRKQDLAADMHAPTSRLLLDAVIRGAMSLQHFPTWDRALAWWAMLVTLASEGDPALQSYGAAGAAMQGDIHRHRGNLKAADTAYRAAMDIAARLVASDPGNAEWQRDLSVSHVRIGNLLVSQGDRAAALDAYRASMDIAAHLAASDPGNAEWQRDLSISHDKVGDVLMAQGDRAMALNAYHARLEIAARLAASDPGNAEWQRDLSVSHTRIGNVLVAQGDRAAALESYRAAMDIAARLAASDPGNAKWQRDLSVSHSKIGNVLVAQGDRAAALDAYRADMDIAARLAASDPGNAEWQRDLSVSHTRIGDVLVAQGDRVAALKSYRAAMDIAGRLAASDPGNAEWQRDLFVSLFKTTTVLLQGSDRGEACVMAQRLVEQAELMAARFPQDPECGAYLRVSQHLLQQACSPQP